MLHGGLHARVESVWQETGNALGKGRVNDLH